MSSITSRSRLALTVYNQGSALVRDTRTVTLAAGRNTLDVTDVAEQIDPTSVQIVSTTDPMGTRIIEQNYLFDLVDPDVLVSRFVDQPVRITAADGTTFDGVLLSGRMGSIILRLADGGVLSIARDQVRDLRFASLPGGLITRPTLRWLIDSAMQGEQTLELTYLTHGIGWSADYIILLGRDQTSVSLSGWITLTNTSGAAYPDATVKLVAGDVRRLPSPMHKDDMERPMFARQAAAAPVEQREFFEYQLYEIRHPVTVGSSETKQVEFVCAPAIPARTHYRITPQSIGGARPIVDRQVGTSGRVPISVWLEFDTGADSGLDADLPAGRMRVYQPDVDGTALLIGENVIRHTPNGERITLQLGDAFDLVAEREQVDYKLIGDTVIDETFAIHLRNRKDDDTVEIRVCERLFRWANWEILSASLPYDKHDARTIEFRPSVPPGEEVVVRYTVRYQIPAPPR